MAEKSKRAEYAKKHGYYKGEKRTAPTRFELAEEMYKDDPVKLEIVKKTLDPGRHPGLLKEARKKYQGLADTTYLPSTAKGEWTVDKDVYALEKMYGATDSEAKKTAKRFRYDPRSIWGAPDEYKNRGLGHVRQASPADIRKARKMSDVSREQYLEHLKHIDEMAKRESISPMIAAMAMDQGRGGIAASSNPLAMRAAMNKMGSLSRGTGAQSAGMAAEELGQAQGAALAGRGQLMDRGLDRLKTEQSLIDMINQYNLKKAYEDEKAKAEWHSMGLNVKFKEDEMAQKRKQIADEIIRGEEALTAAGKKMFKDSLWSGLGMIGAAGVGAVTGGFAGMAAGGAAGMKNIYGTSSEVAGKGRMGMPEQTYFGDEDTPYDDGTSPYDNKFLGGV
jgi:hypothetical protein